MSLNIIVRDKRPERLKQEADGAREHLKGRYAQECGRLGRPFKSRFTKAQIRRIWERGM